MSSGLSLISLGLADERDLSLRALEEARSCDVLYLEAYTTMLQTDPERLSALIGRPVSRLSRRQMEEGSEELLYEAARRRVGILVGGDCLTATTHISLFVEARRRIQARVVHGSSILTAVAEAGLSLYKFGRAVTLPLPEKAPVDTVVKSVEENLEHGLHTLILLDLDAETGRHLTIDRGAKLLLDADRPDVIGEQTLVVGCARLGSADSLVKADRMSRISEVDFGAPPHALVVPGILHFHEAEALKVLGGCPEEVLEDRVVRGGLERLVEKYAGSCRRALDNIRLGALPREVRESEVNGLIGHAERYLRDALYYAAERRAAALASVSYCEGLLDALRLLGLVDFEW